MASNDRGRLVGAQRDYGEYRSSMATHTDDGRLGNLAREKRLEEENSGLKSQLESAREMIRGIAKGGIGDGSKKRLRLGMGSDADGGGSSYAISESEGEERHHPAVFKVDRLTLEVEEERLLREQDRQRFEIVLAEAESEKGKLLRQVKFLAQEEEETRAECKTKQEAFLAETAKLQESLRTERAALAEARTEDGRVGQLKLRAFERRLEREVLAREVAEEKVEEIEAQAKARSEELVELRRLRREGEAANARLSLELASLRREAGAEPTPSDRSSVSAGLSAEGEGASSWDTPVARELRAKIKVLERDARKREAMLQELESNKRNAVLLEDEVETLNAKLERSNAAQKAAMAAQAEHAAIKDEKDEWSLLFARAVREEKAASRFRMKDAGRANEDDRMRGEVGGGGNGEGGDSPTPTPVLALRLLREIQEERSVTVKELTALRVRCDGKVRSLARVEGEMKEAKERADTLQARMEDLQLHFDALQRRCCSAEQEVAAQRELIESYERDNFRKPAGEAWLSGHASLQAALTSSKEEAQSLRESAKGQVSAAEAGRLRERAAKAEAMVEATVKERDQAVQMAERYSEQMAMVEKKSANGTGASNGKALHLKDNPSARAIEAAKQDLKQRVEALKEDNKRLVHMLESSGPGAVDASVSMSDGNSFLGGSSAMKGAEAPDVKKFSTRLSQQYKEKINYYRQAIYTLLGYRVDLMKDPTRKLFRLRSMYAEHESDCLLFQQTDAGLELVETPLALQHMDKIEMFLGKMHSIPAFLSTLTNELFEKQTFMPS